jgi:hypothetical protein
MVIGRHVLVKNLRKYSLLIESRKNVVEDKLIKMLDHVNKMFKDAESLIEARRDEKNSRAGEYG